MAVRRFRTKLLVLVIVALVALQTATLIAVHVAGQRTLRKRIDEELHVGARVLDRVLRTRARQLADTVRVLASDFAFKEAIASGDRPTIDSALHNHGERIAADAVFLIAPDGTVTSDSLASTRTGKPFAFPSLLRTAEENNEASATVSIAGRPYQLVITPVLAPQPIAWVCMGFAIDERVVNDIRRLTSLEVSLWSTATGANPQLVTTLPAPLRDSLVSQMRTLPATRTITETTLPLRDANYATLLEPLQTTDGSKVNMLVQLSFDEARKPFANLELQIFTFTSLALLAAVVAAIIFARAVTRPLRSLADGAERIERGDYVSPIVINQHDEIGHLATSFNNMQQAIALREEQIIYQATHDGLTGLPNRTLFMDRLAQGIAASKRTGDAVGMIMMDLDRFKEINDTLGHHFGDQLLIEIGRRLAATLREGDTVARLGGDEFAVRFMAREPSHGIRVAKRITEALEKPFVLGEVAIDINASIGIATFPTHADDAESLMKRADIAMYEAKKNHERIAVYEAGRDEHSLRRLSLMMELRHAVANNQLDLHYQPKIDVATERVVHAEALARWHHPVHGMMRPDEFIPLAEQTGNIGLITKWVLRRAIHQCATWLREGHDLAVAVNLSALDLFDTELPAYVSALLSQAGLPPTHLILEITESAVMKDPVYGLKILRDLKNRGVTLAIDDFGTGYSSLAHLKRLPVDELKIDKSFVQNLCGTATDDMVIVRSTIELGHNMGLVVIAEGVETSESLQILKSMGCDMAQGFFMSPPLPADKFVAWFKASARQKTPVVHATDSDPRPIVPRKA